jgi:hypothetical protein
LAAVLIFWLVVASFFASNPSLHHWLHHDAGHQTHDCPISLVEKQQILAADPELQLKFTAIAFHQPNSFPDDVLLPTATYNASFGRAPPA